MTASEKKRQTWIIGCGDIGKRVANLYQSQFNNSDRQISAIVSSTASCELCQEHGINAFTLDLDSDYSLNDLDFLHSDIYYFAPPTPSGNQDFRLAKFLAHLNGSLPRRVVLISTTGVYGDSAGNWIDESTPVKPKADRALRRLSAEQEIQSWCAKNGTEYMILRVPGIYAIERLPLERLKKGLPVINAAEAGFTNRIHADDLAQACKAAMETDNANEIINVTDGNPSTMTDYFNQVAEFAGMKRPPQISLTEAEKTLSAGMLSYMKESRRIKNDKMLKLLKFNLRYPDLKTALKR